MANAGPAITISNHPQNVLTNQTFRALATLQAMNLNQIADTEVIVIDSNSWSPTQLVISNASTSLTTAQLDIYTGPNATGAHLFGPIVLTGLTTPLKVIFPATISTDRRTENKLYFRCTTAQGAPATADVLMYGYDISFLP